MPKKIAIITDSTCDIPNAWIKQYDITVIPLTIIIGNEQYLDGVDLSAKEFYERLVKEKCHPTTSQPTPQVFLTAYQQAVTNGAEEIFTITISSAMSGTYESARTAAQDFSIPVQVLDGKNNSMGLGWQVIAAARVHEAGGEIEAMLNTAKHVQKTMAHYITLDTIEYLSKGGRINDATKFLDSLLNIKPLIFVKPESGVVGASMPSRSRKAALEGLYKEFFRHIDTQKAMHIAVMHNNALPEAQALAERVQREHSPVELIINIVSPVLGTHTGAGAVALSGYAESS